MPRIPLASDSGLGSGKYENVVTTPVKGRTVQQELGPKLEVNRIDVKQQPVADLASIKPVAPTLAPTQLIQQGLDSVLKNVESLAAYNRAEIQHLNEVKEKTGLIVALGAVTTKYEKDTFDILNNGNLSNEDKVKELQKVEDDVSAVPMKITNNPDLQMAATQQIQSHIASVKNRANEVIKRNTQDGILAYVDQIEEGMTMEASRGDYKTVLNNYDQIVGAAWPSTGRTQAEFVIRRKNLEQTIMQNDIMGTLKAVDTKAGKQALDAVGIMYNRLVAVDDKNVPTEWTNLNSTTRNAAIKLVIQKKNQIEADLEAHGNKELSGLKSNFSVNMAIYSDALKNGDLIDPTFSLTLKKQAAEIMAKEPDKAAGYMGEQQIQKVEQEYGPAYRLKMQAEDQLFGTGARHISYQDTNNSEALQTKIAQNIKLGLRVKEERGLTFVPVLRNADMEAIARTVEANPANGIRAIDTIKQSLGDDGKNSLMFMAGQMANAKDHASPAVAAIIYNVAKGDLATAQTLANGMEVIKTKAITMPKDADLRDRFNGMIGDAMAENSANRGIQFEAYKVAYASNAARKSIVDGNFDRESANEAFKRVVGTVAKWNGSSVLLPDGMDEGKFRDYLNGISPETVQAWGGISGMKNDKAADFIKDDAKLRAVSLGRYAVLYEGREAITTAGEPFIIDVTSPLIKPKGLTFTGTEIN